MRLSGDGFPIGMFPDIQYDQQILILQPGDLLADFTDGITETPSVDGEHFGEDRLSQLLLRHWNKPLDAIAGKISSALADWTHEIERHDDTTLVLARRR